LDEFELIQRFFNRAPADDSVLVGVGDDGAVLKPDAGRNLVTVIDTLVENVHFPSDLNASDIAFRAVAVNLSDIAAMGARPRWMTLALTLSHARDDWLQDFATGLFAAADEHNVSLVGGDTTRGEQIVITVQINGDIADGCQLTRSGAKPGDLVYVSGTVGDAAEGLAVLQARGVQNDDTEFLKARFCRPIARIELGNELVPLASAAIDLSDGLYSDIEKLISSSGVGAIVDCESIPLSGPLRRIAGDRALRSALTGGDDYELCFTASPKQEPSIHALAKALGLPITAIGRIREGSGVTCRQNGRDITFSHPGYRHF